MGYHLATKLVDTLKNFADTHALSNHRGALSVGVNEGTSLDIPIFADQTACGQKLACRQVFEDPFPYQVSFKCFHEHAILLV